jgi:hypothetical protein
MTTKYLKVFYSEYVKNNIIRGNGFCNVVFSGNACGGGGGCGFHAIGGVFRGNKGDIRGGGGETAVKADESVIFDRLM